MKQQTAILIDPFALEDIGGAGAMYACDFDKVVTEIPMPGSLDEIYAALSHELHPVRIIEAVHCGTSHDVLYVDEEGLWNHADRWFLFKGCHAPLAGRGLIMGTTKSGGDTTPDITLKEARERVLVGHLNVRASEDGVRVLDQHFARKYADGWLGDHVAA